MKYKHTSGFTLLEIIIALFIFAIMSVVISTVPFTVFNARHDTTEQSNRLGELQIALTLFEDDVTQAVNRPITDALGKTQAAFIGMQNSLQFTRTGYPNPLAMAKRSNLQRVVYYLKNHNLIRQSWRRLDRTPETQVSEKIVLHRVDAIKFQYLDKNTFYTLWPRDSHKPKARTLPRAVALQLNLQDWGQMNLLYRLPAGD